MEITALVEDQMNAIKVKQGIANISNAFCIVDRRHCDHDVLYIILTNKDSSSLLRELILHYVIALQFNVSHTVRCNLHYGQGCTRFYPEHLITIMPRFFKRNTKWNYAQNIDKLYEDWYKHGFSVDLTDATFNKYYKIITRFDQISVNYNRNVIKYKKKPNKCRLNAILDVKQCPFIGYIIYCLNIFKEMKSEAIVFDEFDLNLLSECYTHIICVHSFCANQERRKEVKTYVSDMVGMCAVGLKCLCIKQHAMRRTNEHRDERDEKEEIEQDKQDILNDVLLTCLSSLHCYLLHDDDYLYRIRREDGDEMDSNFRFTSSMDSKGCA
eukprot:583714_1